MADEKKKDSRTRDLPEEKLTAPVPKPDSEDDSEDKPHTGRQKKYDGGPIPRNNE